jgi:hypothetical protein
MSLTKRTFELNAPENGDVSKLQYALLRKILDSKPAYTASFYVHNAPYVSFPDPNAVEGQPEREGYSVTLTWPLTPGDKATASTVAQFFVSLKDLIRDTNTKGSLVQALVEQGMVDCTMTESLADVVVGQWLLSEALITSASIDENVPNEQAPPTSMSISIEFSAFLR